ncbi:MAG: hypothetical protein U0174_10375 [Polyangiaceae bacterium]
MTPRGRSLAVVFCGLAFAGLLASSALGISCKPRYALCESSSECSPNACVGGRCVPAPPVATGTAANPLGFGFRGRNSDAGRLAIEKAERFVLRPVEVAWVGAAPAETGRFESAGSRLRLRFAPWVYPRLDAGSAGSAGSAGREGGRVKPPGPLRIRVEEAYLLLHRADGTTADRVTFTLANDDAAARGATGDDVGDVDHPRSIHPFGAEVRVDALSPSWVRLDALAVLRDSALKSGLSLVVSSSDVAGRGVAFHVQTTNGVGEDMGMVGEDEGKTMGPLLELYLTTESLTDAGAPDAATDGGSIRDAAASDARGRKER